LVSQDVLDVNVIQLISANNTYSNIARKWLTNQESLSNPLITSTGHSPAVFDDADTRYIKRNLQSSPEIMELLESDTGLISQVKEQNIDYFNNLYFDYNQACDLFARGHIVGGHGKSHHWLTKLHSNNLKTELLTSLELISNLSIDAEGLCSFFCYPYGLTNKNVSKKALKYFDYCFTTEFGVLTSQEDKEIPRVDVNVLRDFL